MTWKGRESHPEVQEGSGRLTRRSWKGRDTHPKVREGSGDPPKGLGRVGRPTRGPPGPLGKFVSPTRGFGKGRETHPRSGKGRETHPEIREGS